MGFKLIAKQIASLILANSLTCMPCSKFLGAIGKNCKWGPWLVPLYPKLICLGDNVHVHKTAHIVTHDMLNRYLTTRNPDVDFGFGERLGCVDLQDNVYIANDDVDVFTLSGGKVTVKSYENIADYLSKNSD